MLLSNNKIFIVEDDATHFRAYEEMFKNKGLKVVGTTSASDAYMRISSEKPKVVLLDIMLPGGSNGFDVLTQIKRDPDTKNIPVIILTNLSDQEKTAQDLGASAYLVKANTSIDKIVETVMKYML